MKKGLLVGSGMAVALASLLALGSTAAYAGDAEGCPTASKDMRLNLEGQPYIDTESGNRWVGSTENVKHLSPEFGPNLSFSVVYYTDMPNDKIECKYQYLPEEYVIFTLNGAQAVSGRWEYDKENNRLYCETQHSCAFYFPDSKATHSPF